MKTINILRFVFTYKLFHMASIGQDQRVAEIEVTESNEARWRITSQNVNSDAIAEAYGDGVMSPAIMDTFMARVNDMLTIFLADTPHSRETYPLRYNGDYCLELALAGSESQPAPISAMEVHCELAYQFGFAQASTPFEVNGDSRQITADISDWTAEFERIHAQTDWDQTDFIVTIIDFLDGKLAGYRESGFIKNGQAERPTVEMAMNDLFIKFGFLPDAILRALSPMIDGAGQIEAESAEDEAAAAIINNRFQRMAWQIKEMAEEAFVLEQMSDLKAAQSAE